VALAHLPGSGKDFLFFIAEKFTPKEEALASLMNAGIHAPETPTPQRLHNTTCPPSRV